MKEFFFLIVCSLIWNAYYFYTCISKICKEKTINTFQGQGKKKGGIRLTVFSSLLKKSIRKLKTKALCIYSIYYFQKKYY